MSGFVVAAHCVAFAQAVPPLINYQGRLTDAAGQPLATGPYSLAFSVYASAGPGGTAIWGPQLFDGAAGAGHSPQATILQGNFNVILGPSDTQSRALNAAFDQPDRYIEISVSGGAPILPRQRLLSAPFAMTAQVATGAVGFANLAPNVYARLVVQDFSSDGSFTLPSNAFPLVVVDGCGGGGGGAGGGGGSGNGIGSSSGGGGGGGGGGAGEYGSHLVNVTPSTTYEVIVGAGGTEGAGGISGDPSAGSGGDGTSGGSSSFRTAAGTRLVSFSGGVGGQNGVGGTAGGSGAGFGGSGGFLVYRASVNASAGESSQFGPNGGAGGTGGNGSTHSIGWAGGSVDGGGTGGAAGNAAGNSFPGGGGGGGGGRSGVDLSTGGNAGNGGAGSLGTPGDSGAAATRGGGGGGGGGGSGSSSTGMIGGSGGAGGNGFVRVAYWVHD